MTAPQNFASTNKVSRSAQRWPAKAVAYVAMFGLLVVTWPQSTRAQDASQDQQASNQAPPAPAYSQQTPDQLQQLVAPIALYPDSLVAQILAASTFPAQIVEADRWVQNHQDLKGDALAQAVDQMDWDPSVKALTAFPSVLGNMDKNISWTSSLGDAYYNQQQDVMDAVQVMRQKAQQSGNLKSTPQQTVQNQGSTIVIQPANPQVVYVPAYNPWAVYGYPISPWPYWYNYPGIWFGGPYLSFGVGFGVGFFGGFGWGWGHWGADWHGHGVYWGGHPYYSRSTTFYNRNNYYRGGGYRGVTNNVNRGGAYNRGGANVHGGNVAHGNANSFNRGGVYNHPGATAHPFNGDNHAARGFGQPHSQSGMHSGAFSGYSHGGQSRSFSARGSGSFGGSHGGGSSHGGGGGHSGGGGGHGHR
jgi:uncharacterized membrane protein YgcG